MSKLTVFKRKNLSHDKRKVGNMRIWNNYRRTCVRDVERRHKYRASKRLKHVSKQTSMFLLRKLIMRPMGLLELLMYLGIARHVLLLKLIFILLPFSVLILIDNVVIAIVVSTVDVFCCALIFSITITDRSEALVDGKFDYGKYKHIRAKKDTIAILLMSFVATLSILIGHYFIGGFIQIIPSMIVD